ncbi:MAG: biotin--[acetyl-CoA-carboxylase] ligase [Eubacteriales bacterium]|nr:biotin--[acetyl-CoA-carboxylase] ligase [Eubacteriales bacterium]
MNFSVTTFEEIDSTNEVLKREAETLPEGSVVRALHQTAGKGRRGRKWEDDKDSLMFSLLLKENLNPDRVSLLPLLTGVVLYETLEDYGIETSLKWPNDVLFHEKKCCGILLEGMSEGANLKALVLGVGLNLNARKFPEELASKATSLYLETGKTYDGEEVLNHFLAHFDKEYSKYLSHDDSYLAILKEHSYLDGKKVLLNYYGEGKEVTIVGVEADGRLKVLDKENKPLYLNAGEVTLESVYSHLNETK